MIEGFLPKIISCNQSSFLKCRSIIENFLLTQDIVLDIRLRGKFANVLGISKAYDRVSWLFLTKVMRK